MKRTYTIVRYDNGWVVDMKTGDAIKDYSAVFEDEDSEEGEVESLLSLLVNTFDMLEDVEFVFPAYEEEASVLLSEGEAVADL